MANKNRAERTDNDLSNEVGKARQDIIGKAFNRIEEAKENGFYLEAITIVESLISDRLESILTKSTGINIGFLPLGELIKKVEKSDIAQKNDIISSSGIKDWGNRRNVALHEMVKLEEGNLQDWDTKYSGLQEVVEKGIAIFRKIDAINKNM